MEDDPGISRSINFKENNPLSLVKVSPYEDSNEKKPVIKQTDIHGFLIGPGDNSKDKIDVVFMGASTVELENVQENKRFPYLSIKKLNDSLNTKLVSRNAGVGGNILSMTNLLLTTKVVPLNPKYVILSSSLIDMIYLSKNKSYWTGSKKYLNRNNPKTDTYKGIKNMFFPNLWLQLRKYANFSEDLEMFKQSKFSPMDKSRILDQYEKQLEVFINTCLIYGISPILTTDYHVPMLMKANLQKQGIFNNKEIQFYLNELIPSLNNLIEQKAGCYNIPLIKLHELIDRNNNFVNINDGLHLTNLGSEKVSEKISFYLIDKFQNEKN
ncbi:SGNH/GDSL hydrolase family protein [Gillisia sp. Hel_I_86]|uniref:SGNH/GDSL hydrolase family protein n=1 Tax=Gillisia sp. Hel_I_86 TaxID=1249981 RepID=UPI00119DF90C|nr:hypothetical protein [Gillisia sp. Hel_I_86]